MEIKLLGRLEASFEGNSVAPTAAKPRQILALLALNSGHVLPVSTLIEELWGDSPPPSVRTTMQTYIMQLRRLFQSAISDGGAKPKDILTTQCDGYLLDIDPHDVDVCCYEEKLRAGYHALELGDDYAGSRLLSEALELWDGAALMDVRVGLPLSFEVTRLEESRLGALETRMAADMRLGRHQSLLAELASLTARQPMQENFCAHLMLALYRSGRQWQALESYQRLRETLCDELGVDPSARLQALHAAILRSDPALELPERVLAQVS
ncbi:MAG TPA: AfsR/SARP family transcriptional regulator [Propionibacteriaceae bacterium]